MDFLYLLDLFQLMDFLVDLVAVEWGIGNSDSFSKAII